MDSYRVFFRNAFGIVGRQDFLAGDERAAVAIADILCEACSDKCDSFDVWRGVRCVVQQRRPRFPRLSADAITAEGQSVLIECEEAIRKSQWTVASSERLLMRLAELRARSRPRDAGASSQRDRPAHRA
jgi:hypothetical protein